MDQLRKGESELKVHLLFEQSGTFKNEFKKLGYEAYDYDLMNDFGETDYQIDLFDEIVRGGRTNLAYSTLLRKMI